MIFSNKLKNSPISKRIFSLDRLLLKKKKLMNMYMNMNMRAKKKMKMRKRNL
jgi:hypothetical protein